MKWGWFPSSSSLDVTELECFAFNRPARRKHDRYFRDRQKHAARSFYGKASSVRFSTAQETRSDRREAPRPPRLSNAFLRPARSARHARTPALRKRCRQEMDRFYRAL